MLIHPGRAGRDDKPSFSLLYYSRQDASLFEFLARKETSRKNGEKKAERALEDLQKMVDYAMTPHCRRRYLLNHFGEKGEANQPSGCDTCDYCRHPTKVSQAIEQAHASASAFHISKQSSPKWNGQWDRPHGDEEDELSDDDDHDDDGFDAQNYNNSAGGLSITGDTSNELSSSKQPSKRGGASAIFAKYEALEHQQNQKNGFVHFKKKDASTRDSPKVPEHLLKQLSASTATGKHTESKAQKEKTSADFAAEAARLQKEVEVLRAGGQEQDKRNGLKESSVVAAHRKAPPPPPPPISFQKRKH